MRTKFGWFGGSWSPNPTTGTLNARVRVLNAEPWDVRPMFVHCCSWSSAAPLRLLVLVRSGE